MKGYVNKGHSEKRNKHDFNARIIREKLFVNLILI